MSKAATEEEVAVLHSLITKLHTMKSGAILKLIAEAEKLGPMGAELINSLIDTKQLTPMQRWVEYNKVGCTSADSDAETELSKRLQKIKDQQASRVVEILDDNEYTPMVN